MSAQAIRLKVAGHLDELLGKSSGAVCRTSGMQRQLFKTAAALLEGGSAEARTHAKRLIFALKRAVPASALAALQQQCTNPVQERRVAATLELLGPPEAPPRLAQSFAAVLGWDAAAAYARQVRTQVPPPDRVSDASSDELQAAQLRPNTFGRAGNGAAKAGVEAGVKRSTSVHSGFRASAASSQPPLPARDEQQVSIRGGPQMRTPSRARSGALRAQAGGARLGSSVGPQQARRTGSSVGARVGRGGGSEYASVW